MLHCDMARPHLPRPLPPRPLPALPAPSIPVQPLTLASIGRRLWIKYRFTNKRLVITTNSPVLQREVQVRQRGGQRWAQRGGCMSELMEVRQELTVA